MAGASALLFTVVFLYQLHRAGGDVSQFVVAGDHFTSRAGAPSSLTIWPESGGYDGQFYFRLALAPFSTREVEAGIRFDYPVYRQQRILFPLVVHLLSGGRPTAALWLFPALNIVALASMAWLAASLLRHVELNPVWAVVVPLHPGLTLSLLRNLVEPLEIALLLAAMSAILSRRHWLATTLVTAAALTKETALVVPIGILALWIWERLRGTSRTVRFHTAAIPFGVHLLLKVGLFLAWGLPVSLGLGGGLGLPFLGPATLFQNAIASNDRLSRVTLLELLLLAVVYGIFVLALFRSAFPKPLKAAGVTAMVFAISFASGIWLEDWAFLRALSESFVLGVLLALGNGRTLRIAVSSVVAVIWTIVCFDVFCCR